MNATTNRDVWLEQRRTGIGGSDVAGILGLSRYVTPLAVYHDKRGEGTAQAENEAMRWGRYLETPIRQAYADQTGREVRVPADMLRHPEHDFMLANLDGFTDDGRVVEIKTARSADGWGEPGTDQIPQAYLLQVQHYMVVTALPVADVAVLIGGSDFRLYEVPADRELQGMLVDAEAEFWDRVKRGEPPEPTTYAEAVERWGRRSDPRAVVATQEVEHACQVLRQIRDEQAALEAREEAAKLVLLRHLGEADTLVDLKGGVLATWKASAAPRRLDGAALKAAHPAIYNEFLKVGEPSRRLLLK